MSSRYYFNLTNGSHFIHDSEGCQLEDINSAVAFANKAIKVPGLRPRYRLKFGKGGNGDP